MILYRPVDGDVHLNPIHWRPRTAFLMAQLGEPVPDIVKEIRGKLVALAAEHRYAVVDADAVTTGADYLLNIWQLAISVPVGLAIVHEGIAPRTVANIFYELGWMQAYGKETLVIRAGEAPMPSDFARTQYVPYDGHFQRRLRSFLGGLDEQARFYAKMSAQVENNPLLAIDYQRRAFLLSGASSHRRSVRRIAASAGFEGRAKNSVEMLLMNF